MQGNLYVSCEPGKPIVLFDNVPSRSGAAPPQSLTGKAINFLASEWPRLIRVLDHGRVEVDNNLCANAIRPFVMGRKAWLFSNTPRGADPSAKLYSLIEAAKASGLEPCTYLHHTFEMLPRAQSLADFEALQLWAPGMATIAKPLR